MLETSDAISSIDEESEEEEADIGVVALDPFTRTCTADLKTLI